jgi:ABC-type molybdate transport system substrate-binding protein
MKRYSIFAAFAALLVAAALPAGASSLRALADDRFQPALAPLADAFEQQTGVSVEWTFASSDALLDRLLADGSADLFFSASPETIHEAVSRGIADPALRRHVLVIPSPDGTDPAYASAIALSSATNRLSVMLLLDFLVSPAARDAFSAAGFSLP